MELSRSQQQLKRKKVMQGLIDKVNEAADLEAFDKAELQAFLISSHETPSGTKGTNYRSDEGKAAPKYYVIHTD